MTSRPHVIILGAGIIGASIAWHLAGAGARVTVLDAQAPGGVATRLSWGWINASFGNPEPYVRLRRQAMQDWHRLAAAIPAISLAWTGSLSWNHPPAELEAFAAQHAAWGYGVCRVSRAEAAVIEPHLLSPPEMALHVAEEGVVEPLATAQALLAAAERSGATVIGHRHVRALIRAGSRVTGVETGSGAMEADEVVVAAGLGSLGLLASVGVTLPMQTAPGLVVATAPHPPVLNGLLITPLMELRQTAEGRLLAIGDAGERPADLLEAMRGMIDSGAALSPAFDAIAYRPVPQDGFPAVGRSGALSGLYTAVTHSGVTLAPAIGRFAAEELLTGVRHPLLEPYGMGRFQGFQPGAEAHSST